MMMSARAIYHSIPLITFYLLTPSLFSPLFISIHKQLKFFSSWKRRPSPPQEKILQSSTPVRDVSFRDLPASLSRFSPFRLHSGHGGHPRKKEMHFFVLD